MLSHRLPRLPMTALGVLTIVAFGSWFYGFGVLLEPIGSDTGWSDGILSTVYGGSLLVTGLGATMAGRLLDRRGSRVLFESVGPAATVLMLVASTAGSAPVFIALAVPAGGLIGATGYYSTTQAVAARLAPQERTRAVTAITLWGAFASPIFLPLAGWLASAHGWRTTLRVEAALLGLAYAFVIVAVPDVRPGQATGIGFRQAIGHAWRDPALRRVILASVLTAASISVLLLFQVPAMVDAGLALTAASALAGARGLAQLGGRVPLPAVVDRIGAVGALRLAYGGAAAGALLLLVAGNLAVGVTYVVVAGVGIGALSAAEGIAIADLADHAVLGTTMGVASMSRGMGSAVGPVLAGLATDLTGARTLPLVVTAIVAAAAVAVLPAGRKRRVSSSRDEEAAADARSLSRRPAGT